MGYSIPGALEAPAGELLAEAYMYGLRVYTCSFYK